VESPRKLIICVVPDKYEPLNARWTWTYTGLLFRHEMHSRADGRSGVESGYGELEREMVSVWRKKRWMQGERGLYCNVVGSWRMEV
jgi:hypothetical protein